MFERQWTVVRFPDGSWSYSGAPDSPDYADCEVFLAVAHSGNAAVKKAQSRRSAARRRLRQNGDKEER